jgi:hypothetical protein
MTDNCPASTLATELKRKAMSNFPLSKFSEPPRQGNPQSFPRKWQNIEQSKMPRLSRFIAEMRSRTVESAQSEIATFRIDEARQAIRNSPPSAIQITVKIFIATIGAIVFSTGAKMMAANLGRMAFPVSLAIGSAASLCFDRQATRSLTSLRQRQSTAQLLRSLEHQKKVATAQDTEPNELVLIFYNSQLELVKKIEGKNLVWQFPVNAIAACLLSGTEFAISFWFASSIGLLNSQSIQAIAASLPVVLTWVASAVQSECFELPESLAELIPKYQNFLILAEWKTEEEVEEILKHKAYEEGRIDAGIQFILSGDSSKRCQNLAMALSDYDLNYLQAEVRQLERVRELVNSQRFQDFLTERDHLLQEAPDFPFNSENKSDRQILEQQEKVKQAQLQWVEQELPKRERRCQEDIGTICLYCQGEIERLQQKIEQAKTEYETAERNAQAET